MSGRRASFSSSACCRGGRRWHRRACRNWASSKQSERQGSRAMRSQTTETAWSSQNELAHTTCTCATWRGKRRSGSIPRKWPARRKANAQGKRTRSSRAPRRTTRGSSSPTPSRLTQASGSSDLYECRVEEAEGELACKLSDLSTPGAEKQGRGAGPHRGGLRRRLHGLLHGQREAE